MASADSVANANLSARQLEATTLIGVSAVASILLAGAGIKTQVGGLRPSKGLHGSMYYTLSLTRSRLFGVRVSLGLVQTAFIHVLACSAVWLVRPALRLNAAPLDLFKHDVAAFFCVVVVVYSLGVLFAKFLDDLYQTWASVFTLMTVIVVLNRIPLPLSLDGFFVMATLLALSAMLLLVSVEIVRWREY